MYGFSFNAFQFAGPIGAHSNGDFMPINKSPMAHNPNKIHWSDFIPTYLHKAYKWATVLRVEIATALETIENQFNFKPVVNADGVTEMRASL